MAAPMDSMFRLLVGKRKLNFIGLRSDLKRWLATVTNYQTTVDDSLTELKTFRKHPGIMRPKNVKLPDALLQNLNQYLADKPVKQLKPRATALGNYLWSRQQPLEEAGLRAKAQEYARIQGVEDLDEEMLYSHDLPKDRKKKVSSVMNTLRRHVYHWQPITYDEVTVCAYTLARIAPNYATIYRVLQEIQKRLPDFSPQNLLDFGSGIGTASWAAHTLWGDAIKEFYCVDTSRPMHDVAEALMREQEAENEENNSIIKGVYFRHFLPMSLQKKYDLTISAYSLLELPSSADRLNTLRTLWRKTDQFLVLVECGTNEGYKTLMEARDFILNDLQREENRNETGRGVARGVDRGELGLAEDSTNLVGHVFAPCQHDQSCPRTIDNSGTPCNFEQDFHDFNKRGHSSELTRERFCYLVLRKGPRTSVDNTDHWPRIVRPVLPRARHVICRLCCSNGQLEETIITRAKHGRELYRCARYSAWGDLLPISRPQDSDVPGRQTDSEGEHSGID
ncbi:methyltransferase-like protein 17, mitochondrial [Patiria miniata]|uniref:Methyltransferase-like protein 17, mitochondrial n=1 Tax=Patiria miniata TaxID=46514 RepID=A0A914B391_PATMI|nr:methyltransferase-like protein 17, mitochondrial [Patiria miniata]